MKPRIFLGSSGKQAKLLEAITRGLDDVADVEPWTTGTTRSDSDPALHARTVGIYLRADPSDLRVLDGGSEDERAELIGRRLREWKAAANAF